MGPEVCDVQEGAPRLGGEQVSVQIDPEHCFGRPRVRGVSTWTIRDRFLGGDGLLELAEDYGLLTPEVEDAIRYEMTKHRKYPKGMKP